MTGRAIFGDFATAASAYLDQAGPVASRGKAARAIQVDEFTRSLSGVLAVMARYLGDITAPVIGLSARNRTLLTPWARAGIEAREALQNAAALLQASGTETSRSGQEHPAGPAGYGLDVAAASLTAGRDLLHTHLATGPDGARWDRSEWAPVVTSAPVTRALLLELGSWARQIAPQGAHLARSRATAQPSTVQARRKLNAACQWLWILHSAVQTAHRHDPVSAHDTALLHAIPVNALPGRRRPTGRETITGLCLGATDSAERVRHAARIAVPEASWSPLLTADSLREAAACGTATSHHCEVVLRSLAIRAAQHGAAAISTSLLESAAAAAHARAAWLHAAHSWERITTETRGAHAPATAEAADLTLWTGRLAYADPAWILAQGPSQPHRPPESLAPEPGNFPGIVAAVHHTCETLTQMAAANQRQIRTAALAGRLLSPTRTLPDTFDIPHPFAPAPLGRVGLLLAAYHAAGAASARTTTAVATVAAAVGAPSRTLTAARAAIHAGTVSPPASGIHPQAGPASAQRPSDDLPGPVERILHDLGVTSPDTLLRASAIDQAGEQLILQAAQAAGARDQRRTTRDLSRSSGTAELINHALASGDPRATNLRPPPPAREPAAELEL